MLFWSLYFVSGKIENNNKWVNDILEGEKCMEKDRVREGEWGVLGGGW